MPKIKLGSWKKSEIIIYLLIIVFLLVRGIVNGDYYAAVISAVCGITYTVLAGKGVPVCYLIGVTGSGFYGLLSFQNALWGNLLLYVLYYIPMQILGFFKWNKHLKKSEPVIIKESLALKEWMLIILSVTILSCIAVWVLNVFSDKHPVLDGITTVVSICGMYLTVRRVIEQWIAWFIVNALSFMMWLKIALSGERVIPTVIMWAVYMVLAVYFYLEWKKELNSASTKC